MNFLIEQRATVSYGSYGELRIENTRLYMKSFFGGEGGTTVSLPCLVMLQRVSRSYKGHQISEKFDTNEEVK